MENNPFLKLKGYIRDTLFQNSRGSSTMEYVIVIAAVGLLGTVLYTTMNDEGGSWIETTVPKIFKGEELSVGSSNSGRRASKGAGQSELNSKPDFKKESIKKKEQANNLNEVEATHKQLWQLASVVYDGSVDIDDDKMLEDKVQQVLRNENWNVIHMDTNKNTGFAAMAVRNKETGEVVVSYRGSNPPTEDHKDWTGTNAGVLFQFKGQQLEDAQQFLDAVKKRTKGKNSIVLTGHSLGGFLSQKTAAENNLQAVTYNAPGMKPKTLRNFPSVKGFYDMARSATNPNMNGIDSVKNMFGKYDDQIVNYVDEDDLVGTYGVHYGKVITVDQNKESEEVNDYSLFRQNQDNLLIKGMRDYEQFGGFPEHKLDVFKEHFNENGMIE